MPSLRATTSGTTTASGSFFSAIGAPKLAMPVGRAARTIVECNRAGSKPRQTARRPHCYSGPFALDPTLCRGRPMSVLLPKGGMPRVAAECAIVRPIKFGDIVTASSSDHCSDKIEILPHGDCLLWVISGHCDRSVPCPLYPQKRTLVVPHGQQHRGCYRTSIRRLAAAHAGETSHRVTL